MDELRSEIKDLERSISEKGFKYVGKRIPNRESEMKVSGEMIYIDDIRMKGMLYGKMLLSPHPHARIKNIDTTEAEALSGVRAVIHHFNIPHIAYNSASRFFTDVKSGDLPLTEYIFDNTVKFVGDRVAAVAADNPAIAEAAIKLIDVEYEELPASIDFEKSLRHDAPQANPNGIDGSNLCGGWLSYGCDSEELVLDYIKGADYYFKDKFVTSKVHHGYLEPVSHIADYSRSGKLTVWSTCQNVFSFRDVLATVTELPQSRVRVIKTVSGGAFGGKSEVLHEPVVAFLAMRTQKPVKIVLTRKEVFTSTTSRHPSIITVSTGVNKDGEIIGQHVNTVTNTGGYAGSGTNVIGAQSDMNFVLYSVDKLFYRGASFYTNTPNSGAMRGYGSPQLMTARETHMDRIALEMGIDPVDFRLKNVITPNETNSMGNNVHNTRIKECIEKGADMFGWKRRRTDAAKLQTGRFRRGVGMDIAVHDNGWAPAFQDLTTITIKMNNDGTVILLTGTHDLGTGSRTILAQIAGEVLELPPSRIEVIEADTDITPYDMGAKASRTTFIGGNAAILAAGNLRKQLIKEGAAVLGLETSEIDIENGAVVSIADKKVGCSYEEIVISAQTGKHGPQKDLTATESYESLTAVKSYAAVFSEVEVDTETGNVRVIELSPVHNSGRIINPLLFEGQIHGGIQMGLGFALSEEMLIDTETGKVLNPSFRKYKMFRAADMPVINIGVVESPEDLGPFGAKSIGECATDGVAGAVVNAVSHALGNIRLDRLPLSPRYLKSVIERESSGVSSHQSH